jgi:glycosyltransferase involved in cell wall biosynthesis
MGPSGEPTLSVALSTHNSGPYVAEMIASILAQTTLPDEIVVGDDGSTDGTLEVVRSIAERCEREGLPVRWVLLESKKGGLRANMARIFRACSEDVIVVCDHDDVCLPHRFEWARAAFAADPSLLYLHGDADRIDSDGNVLETGLYTTQSVTAWELDAYRRGDAFRVLVRRNLAQGATAAFRRSLLSVADPVPPSWVWDAWYALIAAALRRATLEERKVLRYRQHASNFSGVRRRSPSEKLGMLTANGRARNARLLARAADLAARIDDLDSHADPVARDLANEWLRHERVRAGFPVNRLRRVLPVLREARTGAYSKVTRGRKDLLLDLLQPTD